MVLNRLQFAVDINASRERVWQVLWDDDTYRQWTSVFAEGSCAVSDWEEGSPIQFIDFASKSGMAAIIDKKRPGAFMSFKHMAEIKDGQEQPSAEWAGALENYTLSDADGGTRLVVDIDVMPEYEREFRDKFPAALARVKTLAEGSEASAR